jgi:hypothetical protein
MRDELLEVGYCQVPFAVPEIQRADFARVSSAVIDLAVADTRVREALTFSLVPEYSGRVNPTLFAVSGAQNSGDDKTWIHLGYLSREFADSRIPERNQPAELRALWNPLRAKLFELEVSTCHALDNLGLPELKPVIFHPDPRKRVVLSRTVKYHNALAAEVGDELVSGHGDQSFATVHEAETHGGWFQIAPYPQHLMMHEDTEERRAAIQVVREATVPIEMDHENMVAFFFGVGLKNFCDAYGLNLAEVPGAYHLGRRPASDDEVVSQFANDISDTDRVSVVNFMHPNLDIIRAGLYKIASVSQCRPKYQLPIEPSTK